MTAHVIAEECECLAAIARVQATGEATLCTRCGETLAPTERPSHVGLARSARVQVADGDVLRPSSTPPEARRTTTEDAFTARLRRLVVELHTAELDGAGAAAIQYRERVQTSGGSYDGPRIGAATVRTPVTDKLAALAARDPKAGRLLHWLRAQGGAYDLLAAGRTSVLLIACARDLGTLEQRIAWTKVRDGAEVWARAALGRAMAAWWGEALAAREGATG